MSKFEELFNEKQREVVNQCIADGMFNSIPSALESAGFIEMTPEKEMALQEYLSDKIPVDGFESAVRNELTEKELKGFRIETPEQEKEWQRKIDAEESAKRASLIKENQSPSSQQISDEDLAETILTKAEIMEELKAKNIPFKPVQSKAELLLLLQGVPA